MVLKYGDSKLPHLRTHRMGTSCLDLGIVSNVVLVPGFFYGFLVALCMRLDGWINTNFFALLIPLWVIAIPLFLFAVLNGIATKNTRANKCEKITLSLLVPSGFSISFVFLILFAEGLLQTKVFILLIPHILSLICLYLYLRCLVKPIKIHAK